MQTINDSAVKTLHRLLFCALVEIRAEGHEEKNKVAYHLADLFHNVVLEMENAAEREKSYDDVLTILNERASERGLERWLNTTRINNAESKNGQ